MKTITFPTDKINAFIECAKLVPTDKGDLNPVFKYIKVEIEFNICTLTKANERGFCQYTFDTIEDDLEPFIVNEKILIAFCDSTKSPTFKLKIEGKNVVLTDGYFKQTSVPIWEEVSSFVKLPDLKVEFERVNRDIIEQITIGSNFISNDELQPTFCSMYSDGQTVFSSNQQIIFTKRFKKNIPVLSLTPYEASAVKDLPFFDYFCTGNINIYKNNNVVYGFRIPEGTKPFPHQIFFDGLDCESFFKIKKEDFLNYCKFIMKFDEGGNAVSEVNIERESARIFYENKQSGETNEIFAPILVTGKVDGFYFIPHMINKIFTSIPSDHVCIGETNKGVIRIWDDSDDSFDLIIRKIQK